MLKFDTNPPQKQLRQFGWIGLIGFPAVGAIFHYKAGFLPLGGFYVFIALGVLMGLLAAAKQTALIRPVYVALMVIAYPIGMVVSVTLLAVIYFGMFTPVGLFFRLTGRDPLHRKTDPDAKSYWRVRKTQRTPASYLRLY